LALNPNDDTSFERIVNVPPRGIGDRTIEKIKELANQGNTSLWLAAKAAVAERLLTGKIGSGLNLFIETMESLMDKATRGTLTHAVESVINETGLLQYFREQKGEKSQSRAENLEELLNATTDFEMEYTPDESSPILSFLSYASLEGGERSSGEHEDSVQLMTLHSAKGLEYPVVFICGLEDGLFPHHFSRENNNALEEERRLCYVGITRAMQRLYLTYAEKRRLFGRDEERCISRFIGEIPSNLLKEANRKVTVRPHAHFSFSEPVKAPVVKPSFLVNELDQEGFCLGQRVNHVKFGQGTIIDHEGSGERARIHVHFDSYGSKWLAMAYAKLEPV
jgi:DNA helicase-2/ATP-dependent DNA helicase PcrA